MTTATAALHFHRDRLNGGYEARSDSHRYVVSKHGHAWLLTVQELTTAAGVQHAVGQPIVARSVDDTKTLAVAVANAYHRLGNDYQQHEHGGRSRMTTAIQHAYA
jgi:hypothetical protein